MIVDNNKCELTQKVLRGKSIIEKSKERQKPSQKLEVRTK